MIFDHLADFANLVLTWIGFGTVLGLAAQAVMPGRDPGGTLATLLMSIAGTLIGCIILKYFYPSQEIRPISLEGFSVGAGGALVCLLFYKVLGGRWFAEGEQFGWRHRRGRRRRAGRTAAVEE